jgi:hypothetical protein
MRGLRARPAPPTDTLRPNPASMRMIRPLRPDFRAAAAIATLAACGVAGTPATEGMEALVPTGSLAITAVAVVDPATTTVRDSVTVLISGDRITAVAPAAELAGSLGPGTRIVDGRGRFLVPGFWDLHTHLTMFGPSARDLYVAHGVTGVRDMGARRFSVARTWRDSIADGLVPGPRMRIASPVVENPQWLAAVRRFSEQAGVEWRLEERFGPDSPEAAARWVDSVARLGADHVKVRNWPEPEIGAALVARAAERGLPVVGHANRPFPMTGIASYEHGIWPPLQLEPAQRDSLWGEFATNGAVFVPTLVTAVVRWDPPDTLLARLRAGAVPGLRYVPRQAREEWEMQLLELRQEQPLDWRAIVEREHAYVREMHRAGIALGAGSDQGAPLLVPGLSLHDELERLVTVAGLTPAEALRAATTTPARLVGLQAELGAIAPGRLADLVLLDANPLHDIRNTRRIHAVIAAGRLHDRRALDRLLARAEAAAR